MQVSADLGQAVNEFLAIARVAEWGNLHDAPHASGIIVPIVGNIVRIGLALKRGPERASGLPRNPAQHAECPLDRR